MSSICLSSRAQRLDFKKDYILRNFRNNDTLILTAQVSDCGEWGGHEEELIIVPVGTSQIKVDYLIYSVNCDSAINRGFSERMGLKEKKVIMLAREKLRVIDKYLHSLLDLNLNNLVVGNTSDELSARLSDKSFSVKAKVYWKQTNQFFRAVIKELL